MRRLTSRELFGLAAAFGRTYRLLSRMPHESPERLRDWQLPRLRQLVDHAVLRVPFYRDLYRTAGYRPGDLRTWNDFEGLPLVRKDQVIANYPDRMLAEGTDREALFVSRSSGSTGRVLDIAYDNRAISTFVLAALRLYRMGFNYLPWHRQLYVYTSPYPFSSVFGLYPLRFVSTLTPAPETVRIVRRERPALLVCYPSHLRDVLRLVPAGERAGLGLRMVSVNSEMSTQAERDEWAQALGCPVLDEYSSEELTRIAAQCRSHTYHFFEDINYVEILDGNGRPTSDTGGVTGTNLHNFAMPMIRYVQDDLARVAESSCRCGWRFRALSHLEGRRNDSFTLPSGRVLSSGFLLDATYEVILRHRTAVREFCLIQERQDSVCLQVVPGEGWSADVEREVNRRFHEFLGEDVRFRVQLVDRCANTGSGKRNPIVSRTAAGSPGVH